MKGNGLEGDGSWKGTIWQNMAQDTQIWKQHTEAFTFHPTQDTMTVQ